MKLTTILFDLDGTLLPMDQEVFTKGYFKFLTAKMIPFGYEPKKLVDSIWAGIAAMVKNDGSCSNEQAFWKKFSSIYGEQVLADRPVFDEFYCVEFQQAKCFCGFQPCAAEAVRALKKMGYRVILATNPLFPSVATESRIRWAGFEPEEFEWYTTYENTGYCKPNPDYYRDIAERTGVRPEECLMVGNDVTEDMVAGTLGMKVFLLTDCLINKEGKDISVYPGGGFPELLDYVRSIDSKAAERG